MEYTIRSIPSFGGQLPIRSRANAISNKGTVIGRAKGPNYAHAMQFKNNLLTDLTFGNNTTTSEAFGLNNNPVEQIVGRYYSEGNPRAFMWSNGVFTDLNDRFDTDSSVARDINDAGLIVGQRRNVEATGEISIQVLIYDLNTDSITVPFPDNPFSWGYSINAQGHIVGNVEGSGPKKGYVYNGSIEFLPTLGGRTTSPDDINDSGIIVGGSTIENTNLYHAFIYDGNTIHDIHIGQKLTPSYAHAINNHNVVVGSTFDESGNEAFVKEPGKDMVKLINKIPELQGWTSLSKATDINDEGQICGMGIFNDGIRGFILDPIKKHDVDDVKAELEILVADVLFGVGTGGGGAVVVGNRIIPIDPPAPFRELIAHHGQELGNLFTQQLILSGKKGSPCMEDLVRKVYKEGVENHRKFYGKIK